LLVLKLIATSLTLGSGGSGGVFAPSLFMGAMLGSAFALSINTLFPEAHLMPGAYALVGMAAVFSASAHAPITAILILFELTGDYRIILPLMLTVVVSTVLAQRMLKGESIYTLKLSRRGVRLKRGRDVDILQNVIVEEVMTHNTQTVSVNMSLRELTEMFAHIHFNSLMVLDKQGKLWGVVTMGDIEGALNQNEQDTITVENFGTTWPHLKVAFPDDTIDESLTQMSVLGLGSMPVVSHDDPYHLLGVIRRQDIIQAYNLALTRRTDIEHRTRQMETLHTEGTEIVEIYLNQNDMAAGQTVQALSPGFPKDCVLVSIKRDGRLIIPHGNTVFQIGDHITAFVRTEDAEKLYTCLRESSPLETSTT